jgi:hypothetical protein
VRRVIASLAAAGIVGLVVLPPEHVHHGADHDAPEVVHRHFESHHEAATVEIHVEPPDAETYLSNAFTLPVPASMAAPDDVSSVVLPEFRVVPGFTQWHSRGRDLRVHDPPWARTHLLRGPPHLLA